MTYGDGIYCTGHARVPCFGAVDCLNCVVGDITISPLVPFPLMVRVGAGDIGGFNPTNVPFTDDDGVDGAVGGTGAAGPNPVICTGDVVIDADDGNGDCAVDGFIGWNVMECVGDATESLKNPNAPFGSRSS